jgi:hypothetical protein
MKPIEKVTLDSTTEVKALNLVHNYTKCFLGPAGPNNTNMPALGNYLLGDNQTFENHTPNCPFLGFLPTKPCRVCDSLFPRISGPIEVRCPCFRGYTTQAITDVIKNLFEAYKTWTPPVQIKEEPVEEPIEELPNP